MTQLYSGTFDEYTRPNRVVLHLIDGRKLEIKENRKIKGGRQAYQLLLFALDRDMHRHINPVIDEAINRLNTQIQSN